MKTHRMSLSVVLALALALVACGKLSLKHRAVVSLQATEQALGAAQDFERQTYAAKSLSGLTAQRHADIARAFGKAFTDVQVAGRALKQWRAGEAAPASVAALQKDVDDALAVVKQAVPQGGPLLDKAQLVFDELAKVVAALK